MKTDQHIIEEIKKYLNTTAGANIEELASHLNVDRELVQMAVDFLIVKGKVEEIPLPCSSCASACSSKDECMRWVKLKEKCECTDS